MAKRKANLILLAPSCTAATTYFAEVHVDPIAHAELLTQIHLFRHQIYAGNGWAHADAHTDQIYTAIDRKAWHLIAQDSVCGTILGCIRVLLFDSHRVHLTADDVLSIGGIEFADPHAQVVNITVLQHHLADIQGRSRLFSYVGGLAVSALGQQIGLGARLGLGAAALMRIVQAPVGVTFAAVSNGAARFIQRIGGHALDCDLQPFYCCQHRCDVQLLGLDIDPLDQRTTRIMTDIINHLREQSVLAACV